MGRTAAGGSYIAPHPLLRRQGVDVVGFIQQRENEAYTEAYLESVVPVHQLPRRWYERAAWRWLLAVRTVVGLLTGTFGRSQRVSERQLARRAMMLNCDGQATALSAVVIGHCRSMVRNTSDSGWVHTLAAEVECMRAQYAIWAALSPPSTMERIFDLMLTLNLLTQCCIVYLVAPSIIHAYQVYRAGEDLFWLGTTRHMLGRPGRLPTWEQAKAPGPAHAFYALPPDASFKDVLRRMMADEASLRAINHQLAGLAPGTPTDAVARRQFAG